MICNTEPLFIELKDFDCIAQVARHCDWNQLCSYIREQQNLSLLPKIGQCLFSKLAAFLTDENKEDNYTPEEINIFDNLFCGGTYFSCSGEEKRHFGLKRMLVHYSYGAYIYKHSFVDTPFGVVQKLNDDSLPAPMQELRNLNKDHRNNAEFYWEMTSEYICSIKENALLKPCFDCKSCSCCCSFCRGKGKTKQNRGIIFKNVTR